VQGADLRERSTRASAAASPMLGRPSGVCDPRIDAGQGPAQGGRVRNDVSLPSDLKHGVPHGAPHGAPVRNDVSLPSDLKQNGVRRVVVDDWRVRNDVSLPSDLKRRGRVGTRRRGRPKRRLASKRLETAGPWRRCRWTGSPAGSLRVRNDVSLPSDLKRRSTDIDLKLLVRNDVSLPSDLKPGDSDVLADVRLSETTFRF
jgi:hypothetical protein